MDLSIATGLYEIQTVLNITCIDVNLRRCGRCVCVCVFVCARVCIFCECFCNLFVHWFCNYSETVAFPAQVFRIRFLFLVHVFACRLHFFACVFPFGEHILPLFGCLIKFPFAVLDSAFMPFCFAFRASVFPWLKPVFVQTCFFVRIFSVSAMCRFHSLSKCIKTVGAPPSKVNDTCFNMPI